MLEIAIVAAQVTFCAGEMHHLFHTIFIPASLDFSVLQHFGPGPGGKEPCLMLQAAEDEHSVFTSDPQDSYVGLFLDNLGVSQNGSNPIAGL